MASRVTNQPLTKPMNRLTAMATRKASSSGMAPLLNRVHMSTAEKPKTEPTERSNSPDVISKVIASAIRPSSTVKASVLLMFWSDRKPGLIDQKTTSSSASRTSGPNSGCCDEALHIRTIWHERIT